MTPIAAEYYALFGALCVALISLGGSIFIAERYMRASERRAREDRLLAGIEKILEGIRHANETTVYCIGLVTALSNNPRMVVNSDKTDTRVTNLLTLVQMFAPYASTEMTEAGIAYQQWSSVYTNSLQSVISEAQFPHVHRNLEQAQMELHDKLLKLENRILKLVKERKLIFE